MFKAEKSPKIPEISRKNRNFPENSKKTQKICGGVKRGGWGVPAKSTGGSKIFDFKEV